MNLKTRPYFKCDEQEYVNLDNLYEGFHHEYETLKNNIMAVISTEAPICLTVLKERMRECLNVAKISSKALDIILEIIRNEEYPTSMDQEEIIFWSLDGIYKPSFLRFPTSRNIYEIPDVELKLLSNAIYEETGYRGEALYKAILEYLGYENLTAKALDRLRYIESLK